VSEIVPFNIEFLLSAIPSALILLIFMAGFFAVLANRRRLGKATVPAAFGLALLSLGGLLDLIWVLVSYNLPRIMSDLEVSYSDISWWFTAASLILGLLHLVGVILLIIAVFAGRPPAAPVAPQPPFAAAAPYAQPPASPFQS
jgi:hypothetical protein